MTRDSIGKLVLIIVIIIVIYLLFSTPIKRLKGGKFKYSVVNKRYKLDETNFITTNEPIMNYADNEFDMGVETKPDIFWKMVMFKLLNDNLDRQYNYLWENDYQIRVLNENNVLNQTNNELELYDDIISKIPKYPEKICNLEYNENYYNQHYLKCINTDIINIIRLYTDINYRAIPIEEMRNYELPDFRFTHFHVNYGNNLKFQSMVEFPGLSEYISKYFNNIDTTENGIIMINIYNFNYDYYYNIIEYTPEMEIKTLHDYYWFVVNSHSHNAINYNWNYTSIDSKIKIDNGFELIISNFKIEVKNNKIKISNKNTELKFDLEEKYLHEKGNTKYDPILLLIKIFNTECYKKHLPHIVKTFSNIDLGNTYKIKMNIIKNKNINYDYSLLNNFALKIANKWLVPNPDNIIFKPKY